MTSELSALLAEAADKLIDMNNQHATALAKKLRNAVELVGEMEKDAERWNFALKRGFPRFSFNPPLGKDYWYMTCER